MALTNTPVALAWFFLAALFVILCAVATMRYTQNMLITGVVVMTAIGMLVGMSFLPGWIIIVAVLIVIALIVMERSPNL